MPSTKATSEVGVGNPDLGPIAMAAAGYYKRVNSAGRLGFGGVFVDQLEVPRLTEEVGRHYNFVMKPRIICRGTISVPAGQRPPAGAIPSNATCNMEGASESFSLVAFRRVADTVYVGSSKAVAGSSGAVTSETCFVLVWRDTAWTGAGRLGNSARTCGR